VLLPFQISVLGTPSPAATPTNCSITWSPLRACCTATGDRDRPATVSSSRSSPEPCPPSSPDQSSASNCCPGLGSSAWPTGLALGTGGLAGAYTGARIQSRLPDTLIRRPVGILVIAIGARYLRSGLG
jgi:hypothetical protein